MEKTGRVTLTQQELELFLSTNTVPERISTEWNITDPAELKGYIDSGFTTILSTTKEANHG